MQSEPTKLASLRPLVTALFVGLVLFHLGNALLGKSLIRASHLGAALEYAKGHIDLMRPVIVGFDARGTPAALEFPIWQAVSGLLFKMAKSTWFGWANLVSLALFSTLLWPFHKLASYYVGERAGWWALAFFLAQPLIIVMSGEAATDGFCLVLMVWFLYFAHKMFTTNKARYWFPTALFAALSAVTKLPFFMTAGLCSFFMLVSFEKSEDSGGAGRRVGGAPWRMWLLLGGAGVAAALALAGWTVHANALAAQAEYPYIDLRVSHSPFLRFWYFGDLHYRLSPGAWVKGAWRFFHATLGVLPLSILLVPALFYRESRLPKLWLVASLFTTLVFTHLILAHWHYYLMCCPAVALLCGITAAHFEQNWGPARLPGWLVPALATMLLFFAAIDGLVAMKIAIDYDPFPKMISTLIQKNTQAGEKLIIHTEDPDWGGEPLFRSGRPGLSVMNVEHSPDMPTVKGLRELLQNESDLRRLKELGYKKLVLVSESPVRFAVEASNPGSKRQRRFYPKTISEKVDSWPEVYRSEDLLIKEIP